jgi:hypothetical protein
MPNLSQPKGTMKATSQTQRPRQHYPKCGFAVNFDGQVDILVTLDGDKYYTLNPDEALDLHSNLQKALEDLTTHLERHNK